MSKRLTVEYTRTEGDKIQVSTASDAGSVRPLRDLFIVRINDNGSLFFEFQHAVSLDLSSSNCFSVRIQK